MADRLHHPTELLHLAVDDRLDADERTAVETHLEGCEQCRRELEALRWTKAQLARAADLGEVPADLNASLRRTLDGAERLEPRERSREPRGPMWWAWLAAAAAIVAAVWLGGRSGVSVPGEAAADFASLVAGGMQTPITTSDPHELEARLRAAGFSFEPRVFDFRMMGYQLLGGGVHELAGRRSAMFAYEGPDDRALVCQMYEGPLDDLPPPVERRTHNGIEFLVYREGSTTVVFWREGPIVCVLAADGDPEAAVQLAFAKAIKV